MTIIETFRRLYVEQQQRDLRFVKAVRIGKPQAVRLGFEVGPLMRDAATLGVPDMGECNGVRFYVDHAYDGIEVEFIEDFRVNDVVRGVCRKMGLPCRAI